MATSTHQVKKAGHDIFAILRMLPSPRAAAEALVLAHVYLLHADDTATETEVETKMEEVAAGVMEVMSSYLAQRRRRRFS